MLRKTTTWAWGLYEQKGSGSCEIQGKEKDRLIQIYLFAHSFPIHWKNCIYGASCVLSKPAGRQPQGKNNTLCLGLLKAGSIGLHQILCLNSDTLYRVIGKEHVQKQRVVAKSEGVFRTHWAEGLWRKMTEAKLGFVLPGKDWGARGL